MPHKTLELKPLREVQEDMGILRRKLEEAVAAAGKQEMPHWDNFEIVLNTVSADMQCVLEEAKNLDTVNSVMLMRCALGVMRLARMTDVGTSKEELKNLFSVSTTVHTIAHSLAQQQDLMKRARDALSTLVQSGGGDKPGSGGLKN